MRLRWNGWAGLLPALAGLFMLCLAFAQAAQAAEPAPGSAASAMSSAGWFETIAMKLEQEVMSDIKMLPDTPSALEREWRSFDGEGSARGALVAVGWVTLVTILCLLAERGVAQLLSRRARQRMRMQPGCPTLACLVTAVVCDMAGVAVFGALFVVSRHWLTSMGVTLTLVLLSAGVMLRWRIAMLVVRVLLRPNEPSARPIELSDAEARGLMRFLSATILAVVVLIVFGRYGLEDEDGGAPHVIGLLVAGSVCLLYVLTVFRVRLLAQALIRGRSTGLFGAFRAAIARAWIPIGLVGTAGLFISFVFGLSLGLLSYYRAALSTLAVLLVLLVIEQLTGHGAGTSDPVTQARRAQVDLLISRSLQRIFQAVVLLAATMALVWTWIDALNLPQPEESRALQSAVIAVLTVFVAHMIWELTRIAIDRSFPETSVGPRLPGAEEDEEISPGSRLQTILPMLRAGFGAVIAVVAALTVLSRLGIDTAPLIAGAGVFGLAISFGSQSLVRDIISGLFYIWDDAFRVGEYIDTGRLRGTVEALGVRSMKLRHHNGPLHTIPYGQLGAVTNLSRDFSTMKFNLRLAPGTDIELVRKTAKRIGIEMQDNPEIATEVILPLKMQGIAEILDNALVVRFKFTARPVKPTWVQREYLKRIYAVFADKGICFAVNALTLQTVPPRAEAATNPANVIFPESMGAAPQVAANRVA